jgi:hypothetical protein
METVCCQAVHLVHWSFFFFFAALGFELGLLLLDRHSTTWTTVPAQLHCFDVSRLAKVSKILDYNTCSGTVFWCLGLDPGPWMRQTHAINLHLQPHVPPGHCLWYKIGSVISLCKLFIFVSLQLWSLHSEPLLEVPQWLGGKVKC